MKSFSPVAFLRLLLLLLITSASLLTTACKKDDAVADYSAADDATIKQYLTANNITTAQKQGSGLYFVPGTTNATAPQPVAGQTVSVLYTGYLMDGTVFDASTKHGSVPFSFVLGSGQVIPGFDQGVALMHKGDKATLLIPSALAYGPSGSGTSIPANAVIRFDVELVDINYASIANTDNTIIQKYLAANNITTAQKQTTGLYFVLNTPNPTGVVATTGKTVFVNYTAYLMDGTQFDATSTTPFSFVLGAGKVIAGFDQGVALMHKGEKATLLIPSSLAYGATGAGNGVIPPYSVLRFEVQLVDVQ